MSRLRERQDTGTQSVGECQTVREHREAQRRQREARRDRHGHHRHSTDQDTGRRKIFRGSFASRRKPFFHKSVAQPVFLLSDPKHEEGRCRHIVKGVYHRCSGHCRGCLHQSRPNRKCVLADSHHSEQCSLRHRWRRRFVRNH